MDSDTTRARLAEHTSGDALDELREQLDLTRSEGRLFGVEDVEGEIRGALRQSLTGATSPAEALQRLRDRWVA